MKLFSSRKRVRRFFVKAIKHADRQSARLFCLRWMRGEEEEAE